MANRKQRRKEKRKYVDDYEQSTKTVLITLGVVVGVVLQFYLLTVLINNGKRGLNTKEPTKEETKIHYDEILASDTFKMNDDEYYVLFYDFDGPEAVFKLLPNSFAIIPAKVVLPKPGGPYSST